MSEEKDELRADQTEGQQEETTGTTEVNQEEGTEEAPKELTAEEKHAELNSRFLLLHADFDNYSERVNS